MASKERPEGAWKRFWSILGARSEAPDRQRSFQEALWRDFDDLQIRTDVLGAYTVGPTRKLPTPHTKIRLPEEN